jgi:hypothetical protein
MSDCVFICGSGQSLSRPQERGSSGQILDHPIFKYLNMRFDDRFETGFISRLDSFYDLRVLGNDRVVVVFQRLIGCLQTGCFAPGHNRNN